MAGSGVGDDAGIAPEFEHTRWEQLRREQLGVAVVDPLGHEIGFASADRWAPVDGLKHVLVGEFDHYNWFNPPGSGDEADFNIFISPDAPFRSILNDVAERMNADDRGELQQRERGNGFCVECEITPDEHFYDNSFFPTEEPFTSPLEGRPIGVYGPWVRDFGHGGRPEIHPCEVIWWEGATNRQGVRFTRFFLVLQDDSNRFDRPSNYNGPVPRPWSAFPRRANIRVALQPRASQQNQYEIRVLRSRELAEMSAPGLVTTIAQFRGQPVVTVEKRTSEPRRIRVGLSQVATDPDGEHLRCFLSIGVQLGSGDRGEEGYALIRLETLA